MFTGISLLTSISFYLLYSTSKKMSAIGNLGFEKSIGEHGRASKYIGLALMILSLGLSCFYWGIGAGTFTFFIILMTIASLVILLAPLRLLNYTFLLLTFTCSFIFEVLLF